MSIPDLSNERVAAEIMAFALDEAAEDETSPLSWEARDWLHDRAEVLMNTLGAI